MDEHSNDEEIETAFRQIGLTEKTWGQTRPTEADLMAEQVHSSRIFIRIETTTTPLEEKTNADLAQPPQ
jgi:hypothetical protein